MAVDKTEEVSCYQEEGCCKTSYFYAFPAKSGKYIKKLLPNTFFYIKANPATLVLIRERVRRSYFVSNNFN